MAAAVAAYAVLAIVVALGLAPDALGAAPAMVTLLVLPFFLGVASGRAWMVGAVGAIVLATALLPERTVVETSGDSTTVTVYVTGLVPTVLFALVAGIVAYMGATTRARLDALR